jgi:hypothetical protein
MGKGQNVENQNVESPKKNIESPKDDQKFEKDQNVKSLICLIFKFWWSVNYLWRKYQWCFGVKNQSLKNFLTCLNLT